MSSQDFNSSDVEFAPASPKLPTHLGKKSIEKIIEDAGEDRLTSKRTAKQLAFGHGAIGTRLMQSLWVQRFEAFRKHTLKKGSDNPFSGDDLLRFFDSIIRKLELRDADKPCPNDRTIVEAAKIIVVYGHFRWSKDDGFDVSKHDASRFRVFIDDAVRAKRLVRGKWRDRTWIGFVTLSRMVRAFLRHALRKGTPNWDLIIARTLSVVLVASLGARAGDVARTTHYKGLEYMKYRDIELYLEGDQPIFANLRAIVTIRYAKGRKDVKNADTVHHLRPLVAAHHSHLCPIALLLVHTLRHGLVQGSTLQDVLNAAAARTDGNVSWSYPDRPIVCAFTPAPYKCILDEPAGTNQLLSSIQTMGLVAGMLGRCYIHATRLGAVRDIAHLPTSAFDASGIATEAVRQSIGHTFQSFTSGVTEGYTGGNSADIWNMRAEASKAHRREPRFAADDSGDISQPLALVSKRVSEKDIADRVADTTDKKSRRRAQQQTRRQTLRELPDLIPSVRDGSRKGLEDPSPMPEPQTQTSRTQTSQTQTSQTQSSLPLTAALPEVIAPTSTDLTNVDPSILSEEELATLQVPTEDLDALQQRLLDRDPGDASSDYRDDADESAQLDLLCDGDSETIIAAAENADNQETAQTLLGLSTGDDTMSLPLTATTEQWIEEYASYNVVCTQSFGNLWVKHTGGSLTDATFTELFHKFASIGNSRRRPSPFVWSCRKTPDCPYTTVRRGDMDIHETRCSNESVRAVFEKSESGHQLACSYTGCDYKATASTQHKAKVILDLHHKDNHEFVAKPCEHGCEPEKLYHNLSGYQYHLQSRHSGRWPAPCRFPDCTSDRLFNDATNLKQHLRIAHALQTADDIAVYMPGHTKVKYTPQSCFIDDCSSQTVFKTKWDLTKHLKTAHKKTPEDIETLLKTNLKTETVVQKPFTRKRKVTTAEAVTASNSTAAKKRKGGC